MNIARPPKRAGVLHFSERSARRRARRRYDLAQREGQYAERLRVLCVAVRTIAERAVKR